MEVHQRDWLRLIRSEYLDDFVRAGGAAVKFAVVADRPSGTLLLRSVEQAASDLGYLTARVDASRVRVHMMQDVFHEVARVMPWDGLARAVLRGAYERGGLALPDRGLHVERVAEHNGLDPGLLRVQVQRDMQDLLSRSHELAKDFRMAMLWLCLAEATSTGAGSTDAQAVTEWLRGELRLISAVKRLLIFRRIGRHNARAMLTSLGAWCRMAGHPGLTVALEIRQLLVAAPSRRRRRHDLLHPGRRHGCL